MTNTLGAPHAPESITTDEQLDELMRRVETGDREAQMQIDAWIEEALGAVCATAPVEVLRLDADSRRAR